MRVLLCVTFAFATTAHAGAPEAPLPRLRGIDRGDITVTRLDDAGAGSLRAALAIARKRPGADRIVFAPGLAGTIALRAPLVVDHPVAIAGPGAAALTLDAALSRRHLVVEPAAGAISVAGLALVGADDGAVHAREVALTLRAVRIEGNFGLRGAAVDQAGGVLAIGDSVLRGNFAEPVGHGDDGMGGAVSARGADVHVARSEIHANQAALGGGMYVELGGGDSLLVEDSAIHANSAPTQGGGLAVQSAGGVARIVNSTLSGNRSERNAAIWFDGPLAIDNSTIAFNRSLSIDTPGQCPGLCPAGRHARLSLDSSIVAGNADQHGSPFDLGAGRIPIRLSHSLVQVSVDAPYEDRGGNRIGVDPRLLPLARAGGPTPVHPLAADSPARDAGRNAGGLLNDQRGPGHARMAGAAPDIGAFEAPAD